MDSKTIASVVVAVGLAIHEVIQIISGGHSHPEKQPVCQEQPQDCSKCYESDKLIKEVIKKY